MERKRSQGNCVHRLLVTGGEVTQELSFYEWCKLYKIALTKRMTPDIRVSETQVSGGMCSV